MSFMERFRYDRGSKWLVDHHDNQILYVPHSRFPIYTHKA
jgi:hypothetical protein